MIDANLRSLMEQCNRHAGRGNMIAVNQTMLAMIETLAEMINQPYQCACGKTITRQATTTGPATLINEVTPTVESQSESAEHLQYDADDAEVPTPEELADSPLEEPIVVKRKVGRPRRVA